MKRLKTAQAALAPLELVSDQVRYNLLDRDVESDLLPHAVSEKITLIAYSPLAQGLLTGRYEANVKPSSFIQIMNPGFSSRNLNRLLEVNRTLADIANTHGKTPSQVALNWLIVKPNVVPIPGVKRTEHVVDDAGAVEWRLGEEEVQRLERAAAEVHFDRLSAIPNVLRAVTRRA